MVSESQHAPAQSVLSKEVRAPNLHSLDALRGCLAVYVMLGHARWLLWEGHAKWIEESHPWWANVLAYGSAAFRYGYEAVICFFVLSGFFIHFRWATSSDGRKRFDIRDYARRRAHRLIPPYALALLATFVLDAIGRAFFPTLYAAATGDALLDSNFSRMRFSSESVGTALLMLPGSFGTHFGTNGPLWSLAYEFVYYAAYPLWLLMRMRIGLWAYLVGSVTSVAISLLLSQAFLHGVFLMYPLWLAGAALAEYMVGRDGTIPRLHAVALVGVLGFVGFHFLNDPYVIVAYLLFGIGIVALAGGLPASVLRSRFHRMLEWLGLRSYTIYICHFPLLALISAATFDLAGGRPASGWLALCGVAAALLWCNALWWIGERRFLHARFRLDESDN